MATKPEKQHPENRGDRNPLSSRRMKQQLRRNRFVPKKLDRDMAPKGGTEIDLPAEPKPEVPAQQPQPLQPQPGDPVPLQ